MAACGFFSVASRSLMPCKGCFAVRRRQRLLSLALGNRPGETPHHPSATGSAPLTAGCGTLGKGVPTQPRLVAEASLFFPPFFYGEPIAQGHASGLSGCDHTRRCSSMRHTLRCCFQTAGAAERRTGVRDLPSVAAAKLPGCRGQMAAHADATGGRPSPRGVHADAVLRADHGRARRTARVMSMSDPELPASGRVFVGCVSGRSGILSHSPFPHG